MPFGEVDYSRINGMKQLFQTAIQSQEEAAIAEMQIAKEVDHRKRIAVASEIYRQAAGIAPKNPLVANNMLRQAQAGLLSSTDTRDHEVAKQFTPFPLTKTVTTSPVNVEGYAPSTQVTERYGTEGDISGFNIIKGQKQDSPMDIARKKIAYDRDVLEIGKLNAELKGGATPAKLIDMKEKYSRAYFGRKEVTSRYPESELQQWSEILKKEVPDVLARVQQANTPQDFESALAQLQAAEAGKNAGKLTNLDTEKLRAINLYMRNSADVNAYGSLIKEQGIEYDPDTDKWVKIGAKPTGTPKKKDYTDLFK